MTRKFQRSFAVFGFFLLLLGTGHPINAQNIRLDLRGTDLAQVVAALQQQAPNIDFSFSQEALAKVHLARVELKAGRLRDALEILQRIYGLHYLMDGRTVTFKYIPPAPPVVAPVAEVRKVEGIIADIKGLPIQGATVHVKGTAYSTASDDQGHYSVEAQPGAHLEISSIGYSTQDVLYKGISPVDVRLREGQNALNEVVFIGYQRMRKSDFTGAVASVKASELNISAPTAGQALVGKVAGVVISQVDGSPYASPKIRVRGTGSINASSDPLYVIDGYPSGNDFYINPDDIESIDILKDAASAAIYGSRASGGVVLINTKRGKPGKAKLEYDHMYGVDQLDHKVRLLNSDQFARLVVDGRNDSYKDLVQNTGGTWNDAMYSDNNAMRIARVGNAASVSIPTELYDLPSQTIIKPKYNTDWQDELYRQAGMFRHNLSFSGGNEAVRYMISGSYQSQDGIMLNTAQQRLNFRVNVDGDVSDKVKVGASVAYTGNTNNETQEGRWDHSPSFGALIYMPVFPAYNPDGSVATFLAASESNAYGYQPIENPIATVERTQIKRTGDRSTYNAFATYTPMLYLTFKANLGLQTYNEKYNYYLPTNLSNGTNPPGSAASIQAANAQSMTISQKDQLGEFTLTYDRHFGEHSINILAGYTTQQTSSEEVFIKATGFSNDLIPQVTGGSVGQLTIQTGTGAYVNTLNSYLGRVQYNYAEKYYLSGSLRSDGSSRFGSQNRWALFPSVSGGWNVSKEPFYGGWLADNTTLRLRLSWGLSGNNNIGNYNNIQYTSNGNVVYGNSNTIASAYWPGNATDPRLGWESTSQYNIGLDLGLFHDRVSLIANYYDSRTYNLLIYNNVSAVSGNTPPPNSIAPAILTNLHNSRIRNKGFDFQVDGKMVQSKGGFNFNVSGNISINHNKVLNLGSASTIVTQGAERQYITNITEAGQPIGMFYGYKVAGMVRQKDMAGIAIDDANYDPTTQSFTKGYVLKGPPRSTAQTNPLRPGDLYFQDVNGDGVVNSNDLSIIGTPYAKFTYGFSLSASYRSVDMIAAFAGSYGNQIVDGQDYYLYNMEGSGNQYADVADRYRSESEPGNGRVYRASRAGTQSNSTRLSTFYIQDGSFIRCTNITLGYNVPTITALRKAGIHDSRLYASVNNAFTITRYKGYNPEVDYNYSVNGSIANLAPGIDYGLYPLVRAFNLGIHVTF
jgi:TonB-linked SusC/RagA family outer membrane protein